MTAGCRRRGKQTHTIPPIRTALFRPQAEARAFFRWYGRKKPEQRDDLRKRKKRGWQNIRQSLFDFCTEHHRETLLTQWNTARNAPLTPQAVTYGSHKRVWWRCERGHGYEAMVSARVWGSGCPYCAGRRVQAGENDFAARFPRLAAQWDPDKNGDLTPDQVTESSNRRVWWLCDRGHSYRTTVAHRARSNSGCPYCTGRKVLPGFNDLATLYPAVAAQWHPTLNGTLLPTQVTAGCRRKVWWLCPENHTWKAVIYSRTGTQQSGCPVCAGKTRQRSK